MYKSNVKPRKPHFLSSSLSLSCLFNFFVIPLPPHLLPAHCRRVLYWWVWQDREPAAGSARSHGAADGESGEGRNSFLSARQNISHRSCQPSRGTLQPREDCLRESEVSGWHSVHWGFFLIYFFLFLFSFFTKLLLEDNTARLLCRMGSALLSRFDVVFILLDIPDESHDRQLSEHVMANRTGGSRSSAVVRRTSIDLETSVLLEHSDMTLSDRLQVKINK